MLSGETWCDLVLIVSRKWMNQEQSGKDDEPASRVNSFMHGSRNQAACVVWAGTFGIWVCCAAAGIGRFFLRVSRFTVPPNVLQYHAIHRETIA